MSRPRSRPWTEIDGAATDRGSGSAEIARRAADALAALPRGDLEDAVAVLLRGHPEMAALWRLATDALVAPDHTVGAREFARRLDRERDEVAARASPLIRPGPVVTHSYSGTLVAAVARAGVGAICGRSVPGDEGDETARRLGALGVDAGVAEDRDALEEARSGRTVVAGADAVGPGGVVNKVGTLALAEAAPGRCVIVAGTSKFLALNLPAPEGFDRTPLSLLAAVVTEQGPLSPDEAAVLAERFIPHPALADLRKGKGPVARGTP